MEVIQLLQSLLILHLLMTIVSAGTNVNRQLDIPAFQSFFTQASSQRSKDDGRVNIGPVVSSEFEALKPSPPVDSEVGSNDTSVNNENLIPKRDSKSEAETNHLTVPRHTELRNVSGYQQASSGLINGRFSPSLSIPSTAKEKNVQDFELKPMLNGSSHGSILLNSAKTGGTPNNQHTVLDGKSELLPFRPDQPISAQSSNFRAFSSTNNPTAFSVSHFSKLASTRAMSNHRYVNTHIVPAKTVSYDDWIPITQPIQLPVTSLNSDTVTNKPPGSNGLSQSTTSNPSTTTLKREEEYRIEKTENKTKGSIQFGNSPVTALNGDDDVDNVSNPSFLRGLSFKKPITPLYGQVLYPPPKYAPAKRPLTKYVSKIVPVPPKSVNEIVAGGAGVHPPIQPVHQYNPPPGQGQFKSLFHVPHKITNNGQALSGNSLNGNGGASPFQPIKTNSGPELPTLRQLSGGVNGYPPIRTNFEDGYVDDVGTISSFSYFRNLNSGISGPKGFDDAFSIHAGRNIAKEFNKNMFDNTGFPGNGPSAKKDNHVIGGRKY